MGYPRCHPADAPTVKKYPPRPHLHSPKVGARAPPNPISWSDCCPITAATSLPASTDSLFFLLLFKAIPSSKSLKAAELGANSLQHSPGYPTACAHTPAVPAALTPPTLPPLPNPLFFPPSFPPGSTRQNKLPPPNTSSPVLFYQQNPGHLLEKLLTYTPAQRQHPPASLPQLRFPR